MDIERPVLSKIEQLLLSEIRETKDVLKDLDKNIISMKICHLENKNEIKNLSEKITSNDKKLEKHLLEHKENKKAIVTPLLNWLLGGGFFGIIFAIIFTILKYLWSNK